MQDNTLEKVLDCKDLPSLPAVAAKVVELTQNRDVSVNELANTIRNDQGLSTKILRTVNSSFYALRKPCATISQAIVLLGMSAVKTLALGFSLVSSLAESKARGGFDFQAYWRRSLFTGVSAKMISAEAELGCDEEAFLGGLLQDVGMIALHRALGGEYERVLSLSGGDHRQLSRHELAELGVQHADIGALLCAKWRLPDELTMPVKFHERPTAAPQEHVKLVQAVALGNIACDLMEASEPAGPLKKFYEKAEQWCEITPLSSDELIKRVAAAAKEMASLLKVDTGKLADPAELLEKASASLREMSLPLGGAGSGGGDGTEVSATIDPLTGLPDRATFFRNAATGYEIAKAGGEPVSVALLAIDRLAEINAAGGPRAGDELIVQVAKELLRLVPADRGVVCRYAGGVFGVVMGRTDRVNAAKRVEDLRVAMAAAKIPVPGAAPGVTVSAGVVTMEAGVLARLSDVDAVISTAEQALGAAQRGGMNSVRVYTPKAA